MRGFQHPRSSSQRRPAVVVLIGVALFAFVAGASALPTQVACFGRAATILGTEGPDQIGGTPGDDVIVALGGNDTVFAREGSDTVCGDAGTDIISGGPGNDEIDGGAETDGILGGPEDDRLIGGEGTDLAVFFDSPAAVQVSLATGVATGNGTDNISGFEVISGSPHGDVLEGDAFFNIFFPDDVEALPSGGDDVIRGGGGLDVASFQNAVNASLATRRSTGEGNDELQAIEGFHARERGSVFAGNGADNYLMGSDARDVIDGAGGNDLLIGHSGNDQLAGGAGADVMSGGPGDDALDGGPGSDLLNYLNSSGRMTVDLATRRASGEGGDTLRGFETVAGSQNGDVLRGDGRANTLQGKGGNDRLEGRAGDDFLDGGGDSDRVIGGPGRDFCLDGERLAGCETRERTRAEALSNVVTSVQFTDERVRRALARESGTAPVSAPSAGRSSSLRSKVLPLLAASSARYAAASPRDGITYLPGNPKCIPRGRGAVTSIMPPKGVQPLATVPGQQTARWQGLLTLGNRVVFRTPFVEAVISAPGLITSGWPAEWREAGTRRPYRATTRPLARASHRWKAELSIVEGGRAAIRHDVVPPGSCPAS